MGFICEALSDVVLGHQRLPRSSQDTAASPGTPAGSLVFHGEGAGRWHLQKSLTLAHHAKLHQPEFAGLSPCPSGERGEPSGQRGW